MLCAPGVEQSVDESVPLRVLGGIGGDPVEQVGGDHSREGHNSAAWSAGRPTSPQLDRINDRVRCDGRGRPMSVVRSGSSFSGR